MRDINDLYCILKKNNFKIEWDTLFFRSKELGIYSLMRILFTQLIDVYGIVFEEKVRNQFNLDKDLYFRELLFRKYNLGNESAKGSILLEMNFLFENYKKIFKLRTLVFHILKIKLWRASGAEGAYSCALSSHASSMIAFSQSISRIS